MKGKSLTKKARTVLLAVLAVYAVTVATHLGEFWPFSIYPMFSQEGNPWSRALVREIPDSDSISWSPVALDDMPGLPYGVATNGVDPIDLANFVSKTQTWSTDRVGALSLMLLSNREADPIRLQVFRVQARLTESNDVDIQATPYVIVGTGIEPGIGSLNPVLVP